ncbi:MAG: 2-amino-4-hydroxy-6-hydroxymethyldihydropteridine diphosphokinase [Candidatus Sumerlaeia bacterium]|nr:2-amino-4-hydroxy-6-hydroxymethyldihydropteridine diphosphokinase [Candidatus Sumerlaeia bacterium]
MSPTSPALSPIGAVRPQVFLGLGANVGDPISQLCRTAAELVSRQILLSPLRKSSLYRTAPWGPIADQPWFVNAVVCGTTVLEPLALLRATQRLEQDMGRPRGRPRYGPRVIDVDLLLYDRCIVREPDLIVPHPHMASRAFVLVPLLELDPHLTDPVSKRPYAEFLPALAPEASRMVKLQDLW